MSLEGIRVVVIEDEALLAMELEDQLRDLGCEIAGTAARLQQALDLAENGSFDLAFLDMNLFGERIDPVARRIADRDIPIIFITGYGERTLPPEVVAPVVDKPFTMEKLLPLISALLERRRG